MLLLFAPAACDSHARAATLGIIILAATTLDTQHSQSTAPEKC